MSSSLSQIRIQIDAWKKRGIIKEITNESKLQNVLREKNAVYCGFDPTSSSLHIGHLLPFQLLRELSIWGCPIVILLGGATALVGDPSFRSQTRNHLSSETVQSNQQTIEKQIRQLLPEAQIVNNWDWYQKLSLFDFLKNIGQHFTVNKMLERKGIRQLYKNDFLLYNEFSYILLQAYDFYHLSQQYDCYLQVGGSDQYPNITFGIDFIKKMNANTGQKAVGITTALLSIGNDKTKISKTGPRDSGFFLNDMKNNLYELCLCFETLEESQFFLPEKTNSQQELVSYLSKWVFGVSQTKDFQKALLILQNFEKNFPEQWTTFKKDDWDHLVKVVKSRKISRHEKNLKNIMLQAEMVSSLSEARRLIEQGGIQIANRTVRHVFYQIKPKDLVNSHLILRFGKKRYYLINFED